MLPFLLQGQIQNLLSPPSPSGSSPPPSLCGQDISDQIVAWQENPFDPHLIARMRTVAYRMKVVMAYIDNLIAWGDYLFRQNTRESINEATQIYVLAQEILGPRPTEIPQRGTIQDYTYHDLTTLFGLDDFSNTLVLLENQFPFTTAASSSSGASSGVSSAASTASMGFYFCIPPNDQLSKYWDTVAGPGRCLLQWTGQRRNY